MSLRAVLYARYSSDKQRETSIDDQLRHAKERAAAEGWTIVAQFSDEGVSGSVPVSQRKGGKALIAAALAKRFDVLIVEGLDRLSREVGEGEAITKRLEHRGIRIIGTADGYDSSAQGRKVMRIARGLVNELYLDDLREKTHRGLAGQFDRGCHVGGVCYGYRSEAIPGAAGKRLVIDEPEASIVRQIFEMFAEGHSARYIAHHLNDRGVRSPRGGTWAVSALVGDTKRGAGLLNNEQYIGRLIWNRRQWIKDPETGKRRALDRPREEWQVREEPSLRIIPQELWDRVRSRHRCGPRAGTRTGRGAVPRSLFSGLLRCATCGGPMVAVDRYRYGCNRHNDRGASVCASQVKVSRQRVEARLLGELRSELLTPEALAEVHAGVRTLLAERLKGAGAEAADLRSRLDALGAEVSRLVDAIATIGVSPALAARLRDAEGEQQALLGQIQATERAAPSVEEVMADAAARYRRLVLDLGRVLEEEEDRAHTRALLAELLGPVVVGEEDGEAWAEIEEPAERLAVAVGGSMGLVAGARFELATVMRLPRLDVGVRHWTSAFGVMRGQVRRKPLSAFSFS